MNIIDILMGLKPKDPKDAIIQAALAGGGGGQQPLPPEATLQPVVPESIQPEQPDIAKAIQAVSQQPLQPDAVQPQPPEAAVQPEQPPQPQQPPAETTMPSPIPESMKSPPDLVEMYTRLMDKSRNAAALDSGLTLIAAGLAQDQNKQALIQMAGQQGGAGDISMTDLINLQKLQQEQEAAALSAAELPALAAKYKLDMATVRYLHQTGQLDEAVKELATPGTQVVEAADGSKKLINNNTGETIRELSGAKARETTWLEKPDGSKVLVYKDDSSPVSGGKPITELGKPEEKKEFVTGADGVPRLVGSETGKEYGKIGPAKEPGTSILTRADGSQALINSQNGDVIKELGAAAAPKKSFVTDAQGVPHLMDDSGKDFGTVGPGPDPETQVLTRPDGSQALINSQNGDIVKELSAAKELNADDKDHLAQINKERAAAGQPAMTTEEFLTTVKKGGVSVEVNTGPTGIDYGNPPNDMAWKRDANGKVVVDENGAPIAVLVKGSPEDVKRSEADAKVKAEAAEKAAAEEQKKGGEVIRTATINEEVDRAVNILDKNADAWVGVTGLGSLPAMLPMDTEAGQLQKSLTTIKGIVGFKQLQRMRDESKTGGALGQVSDFENRLLQALEGNLAQTQNDKELKYNLQRIKKFANIAVTGSLADVEAALAELERPPSLGGKEEPEEESGYKIEKVEED